MAGPVAAASPGKLCWPNQTLTVKPGESKIRKGLRQAYVPIPRQQPKRLRPLPTNRLGVIRRIDLPPGDKRIALTFDLCEQPHEISGYQGGIVDYLRAEKVPATFFAGGKWLLTHPRRASQLIADPRFEVANHSWEHRNHRLLSTSQLSRAIDGAQTAYELSWARLKASSCIRPGLTSARGEPPAYTAVPNVQRLYRFPFGACNPAAIKAVNQRGLMIVQWDVSSADPWRGLTAERMVKDVVRKVRPGSIVLFHANGRGWKTGQALPLIIKKLRDKGYLFDTVGSLLATQGAKPVIAQTCYDARPGDSERYDKLGGRLMQNYNAFYRKHGVTQ